jgi:predicted RNase H-like HicB family nuclease
VDVVLPSGDRARLTPAGEGGFVVEGLNRPGLVTQGETLDECAAMAADAAACLGGEADETLATAVRLHVLAVYGRYGRNKTRTARALGVVEKTVYNALNRYVAEGHITREEAGIRARAKR